MSREDIINESKKENRTLKKLQKIYKMGYRFDVFAEWLKDVEFDGFIGFLSWTAKLIIVLIFFAITNNFLLGVLCYIVMYFVVYLISKGLLKKSDAKIGEYQKKYDDYLKEYMIESMLDHNFDCKKNEVDYCGVDKKEIYNYFRIIDDNTFINIDDNGISIVNRTKEKYEKIIILKYLEQLDYKTPIDLKLIKFSYIDFNKKYAVYSTQQKNANMYLTPNMQKNYLDVYDSLDGFMYSIIEDDTLEVKFKNDVKTINDILKSLSLYYTRLDKYVNHLIVEIDAAMNDMIEESSRLEDIFNKIK